MANSRELIESLIARGFSQRAIGRAVGRDSSLIAQIRKGAKPGANLTPALAQLAATGKVESAPERRTTKAGGVAKVRRPTKPSIARLTRDAQGRIRRAPMSGKESTIKARLQRIARAGGRVVIVAKWESGRSYQGRELSSGRVRLYEKGGGIRAQTFLNDWQDSGETLEDYLTELALEQNYAVELGDFEGVELIAAY